MASLKDGLLDSPSIQANLAVEEIDHLLEIEKFTPELRDEIALHNTARASSGRYPPPSGQWPFIFPWNSSTT